MSKFFTFTFSLIFSFTFCFLFLTNMPASAAGEWTGHKWPYYFQKSPTQQEQCSDEDSSQRSECLPCLNDRDVDYLIYKSKKYYKQRVLRFCTSYEISADDILWASGRFFHVEKVIFLTPHPLMGTLRNIVYLFRFFPKLNSIEGYYQDSPTSRVEFLNIPRQYLEKFLSSF